MEKGGLLAWMVSGVRQALERQLTNANELCVTEGWTQIGLKLVFTTGLGVDQG